jgi:hypothetical protein
MLKPLSPELDEELSLIQKGILVNILDSQSLDSAAIGNANQKLSDLWILNPGGTAVQRTKFKKLTPKDIYDVQHILQEIVDLEISRSKPTWFTGQQFALQRPFIREDLKTPIVVFKVINGQPGVAGSGPQGSPTRRMVRPIFAGSFIDPLDQANEIYMYHQRMDYVVNIDVYGETAHEADIIKEWMAELIKSYVWYAKHSGVLDITFIQELSDETESFKHKRSLQYSISFIKHTWTSYSILRNIALNISIS